MISILIYILCLLITLTFLYLTLLAITIYYKVQAKYRQKKTLSIMAENNSRARLLADAIGCPLKGNKDCKLYEQLAKLTGGSHGLD